MRSMYNSPSTIWGRMMTKSVSVTTGLESLVSLLQKWTSSLTSPKVFGDVTLGCTKLQLSLVPNYCLTAVGFTARCALTKQMKQVKYPGKSGAIHTDGTDSLRYSGFFFGSFSTCSTRLVSPARSASCCSRAVCTTHSAPFSGKPLSSSRSSKNIMSS